jgi:protease-4
MDSNDIPPIGSTPPPPFNPPPVIISGVPTRPRKSRGWMIVAIVLLVLLALSLFGNLSQWVSGLVPMKMAHMGGSSSGPRLDETILEDNDSANKIAVVDVEGIITSRAMDQGGLTMVELIKEQLKRAGEDDRVKAVLLRVDSPGGEVLASDEIYRIIADFQKGENGKPGKPVITSMGNLAASGGYYISSASRWIVANELTITGSIGVILHSWNYRGLMNKVGIAPETYKSGKFKDMLSGERNPDEILPEEREMLQSLINETYGRFKDVVAEGRDQAHKLNKSEGKALAEDWKDYADGRILMGKRAEELGFVDQLGNFDVAAKRARLIAHIKNANLVQYKVRYDLSDFFRMFGKTETPVIKVDVGMEGPKLQAGQLYFLSPIFLH